MSLTPYRDAAMQSVAQMREFYAAKGVSGPERVAQIAITMAMSEACLFGNADLKDLGTANSVVLAATLRSVAIVLTSTLLTLAGADRSKALASLGAAMGHLNDDVAERLATSTIVAKVAVASGSQPRGNA